MKLLDALQKWITTVNFSILSNNRIIIGRPVRRRRRALISEKKDQQRSDKLL